MAAVLVKKGLFNVFFSECLEKNLDGLACEYSHLTIAIIKKQTNKQTKDENLN